MRRYVCACVSAVLTCAMVAQAAPYWSENFEAGLGSWVVNEQTPNAPPTNAAPDPKGLSLHIQDGAIQRIARTFDSGSADVFVLRYLFYTNITAGDVLPIGQRYFGAFMVNTNPPAVTNATLVRIGSNNATNYQLHYGAPVNTVDTGVPVSEGWHTVEIKLTLSTTTIDWKLDRASGSVIHAALTRPNSIVLGYNFSNGTAGEPDTSVWFDKVSVGPPEGVFNLPPLVNAGVDQAIELPSAANLDGTVSDDELPNPPGGLTTNWSKLSGPGTVIFGNASAVDTTASFSEVGEYVLRLLVDDGELKRWDEVTVTVNSAAVAPAVTDAVSVKTQGGNDFSIDVFDPPAELAIHTNVTECRAGGPTQVVVTFDGDIQQVTDTNADVALLPFGTVTGLSVDAAVLTIDMNGAAVATPLLIGFPGIAAAADITKIATDQVCIRVLAGDVSNDGSVNVLDLVQVRNQLNQAAGAGNFRADVSGDGTINVLDLVAIRNALNTSVASCP